MSDSLLKTGCQLHTQPQLVYHGLSWYKEVDCTKSPLEDYQLETQPLYNDECEDDPHEQKERPKHQKLGQMGQASFTVA